MNVTTVLFLVLPACGRGDDGEPMPTVYDSAAAAADACELGVADGERVAVEWAGTCSRCPTERCVNEPDVVSYCAAYELSSAKDVTGPACYGAVWDAYYNCCTDAFAEVYTAAWSANACEGEPEWGGLHCPP